MDEGKEIEKRLRKVIDPELGFNIVELGLVYEIKIKKNKAIVKMTFTTPSCPLAPIIIEDVKKNLKGIKGIKEVEVVVSFDPPWTPEMASGEARAALEQFMGP